MKYRVRSGVVYRCICGEHLLIATLDAQKYCPYSTSINEDAAFVWKQAASGASDEDIIRAVAKEYEQPEDRVRNIVTDLLGKMVKHGFLVVEEEHV